MIVTAASKPHRRVPSTVTHGTGLTFETLAGTEAPLRVIERQDTLLRVVAGPVRLTVDAAERVLETGDEAIVPAGHPHRIASAADEARIVTGLRRAG